MFQRPAVRILLIVVATGLATVVHAQDRPQVSPGVERAVLLATNSIQLERDVVIVSGDVIVNNAATTPVLGERELSLDRGASTPAGFKLAAHGVDLDSGAVAGGAVHYNTLSNGGTIAGPLVTPLALPVFTTLPPAIERVSGTQNVVQTSGSGDLGPGEYAALSVGRNATVRLTGGGYTFTSISVDRGGSLRFLDASNVVVNGNVTLSTEGVIAPASGAPITAAGVSIQVHGSSMTVGADAAVSANVHLTAGSLTLGQQFQGTGSFIARNIFAGRSARFTLQSGLNLPPVAQPQDVFTNGAAPIPIILRAADAEGAPLTFAIISAPAAGTLSGIAPIDGSSASVTYTPASGGDVTDSFTYRATDPGSASGTATVTINSPGDTPPPDPTTVTAIDDSHNTPQDVPVTLLLRGTAPAATSLSFSIVASSGPFHGTLGAVVPGSESPQRSATVLYTPGAGYSGSDSFQFEACGVIGTSTVCDTATFAIEVRAPEPPQDIAVDIEVSTLANAPVVINLFSSSSQGSAMTLKPLAVFQDDVEIAGNVADANNDGIGDNHNALPGSVPVFMSADRGGAGGAGSDGTQRMHFEWDITGFNGTIGGLVSAHVSLPTHRGTIDSLDTFFYASGSDGDGLLTDSDFAIGAERISNAVMKVPSLVDMPAGTDGFFTFSVFAQLKQAVEAGFDYFVIQGRVDENGPAARGLEVRTTATGNGAQIPRMTLATPGVTPPTIASITSLPAFGVLHDGNTLITSVPHTLSTTAVKYTPNTNFTGDDTFGYSLSNGLVVDAATVTVRVRIADCASSVAGCDNGR